MENSLPPIPAKRYFTIGEVGALCCVKPHVLRYWEQEFTQLRPMKRRGNRRYYQHHEVLMIRRIRGLLYEQGFTISGARNKMIEMVAEERQLKESPALDGNLPGDAPALVVLHGPSDPSHSMDALGIFLSAAARHELLQIRDLLAEVD